MAKKGGWKWGAYKRNKHKARMKAVYARKAQERMLKKVGERVNSGEAVSIAPMPALEHHFGPGCIVNIQHAVFHGTEFGKHKE